MRIHLVDYGKWQYATGHMAVGSREQVQDVVRILGGRQVFKEGILFGEFPARIRKGLPIRSLETLQRYLALREGELTVLLGISARTLARRKKTKTALSAEESDRLYRIARVAAFAEEILGARDKARRWLRKPNRALGDCVPMDLLDTEAGSQQVVDVLGRIDAGVFS